MFCKTYRDVITVYQYFKRELQKLFTEPPGSIAFGMGINCPDVRHVIHWGTPADAEMYMYKRVEVEAEMDFCHVLQFCAVLQT